MATKKSGKSATFKIATAQFHVNDWSVSEETDTPDATDSSTAAGFKEHVIGRKGMTITIKGVADVTAGQVPDAKIGAGTALTNIELSLDGTLKYVAALATAKRLTVNAPIGSGDPISFDAEVVVNGSWTPVA